VPNKFPACGIENSLKKHGVGMYDMMANFGAHEVIIETPDHQKELKDRTTDEITEVITVLQDRVEDLHKDKRLRYILVFKNKGRDAGASLMHPHHQLIALPITPKRVREELHGAENYFKLKERCIFCDLMEEEISSGERMVYENDAFMSFCPYAARFPFETWILPKDHSIDFYGQKARGKTGALADILKTLLAKFSKVLNNPSYNYIIHAAPNRFPRGGYWQTIEYDFHWHIELWPKLTQVAGFEWGSGFYINPVSPEAAAGYLRNEKI
jgi:UDPglucose--hexose-1-phosphate uridylyltransferase